MQHLEELVTDEQIEFIQDTRQALWAAAKGLDEEFSTKKEWPRNRERTLEEHIEHFENEIAKSTHLIDAYKNMLARSDNTAVDVKEIHFRIGFAERMLEAQRYNLQQLKQMA